MKKNILDSGCFSLQKWLLHVRNTNLMPADISKSEESAVKLFQVIDSYCAPDVKETSPFLDDVRGLAFSDFI